MPFAAMSIDFVGIFLFTDYDMEDEPEMTKPCVRSESSLDEVVKDPAAYFDRVYERYDREAAEWVRDKVAQRRRSLKSKETAEMATSSEERDRGKSIGRKILEKVGLSNPSDSTS
jgi:hypothetical protein